MPDDYDQKLAVWMAKHGVGREVIAGTTEHADAEEMALRVADKKLKGEDYCVICGHGPQPISGMELITRRDDPYIQPEDDSDEDEEDRLPEVETRVRACPKCWAVKYGDEDELSDEDDTPEASNAEMTDANWNKGQSHER